MCTNEITRLNFGFSNFLYHSQSMENYSSSEIGGIPNQQVTERVSRVVVVRTLIVGVCSLVYQFVQLY